MKATSIFAYLSVCMTLFSCNSMDDNYKHYLDEVEIYSPRITNLAAVSGLKEATLTWKNPHGSIAVRNAIRVEDSTIVLTGLVENYKLTHLQIRGYQISVYTIDQFNHYSVPATINIFPNGE